MSQIHGMPTMYYCHIIALFIYLFIYIDIHNIYIYIYS